MPIGYIKNEYTLIPWFNGLKGGSISPIMPIVVSTDNWNLGFEYPGYG